MKDVSQHTFDAQDRSLGVWEAVWCLSLKLKLDPDIAIQLADAAQQKTCEIYELKEK